MHVSVNMVPCKGKTLWVAFKGNEHLWNIASSHLGIGRNFLLIQVFSCLFIINNFWGGCSIPVCLLTLYDKSFHGLGERGFFSLEPIGIKGLYVFKDVGLFVHHLAGFTSALRGDRSIVLLKSPVDSHVWVCVSTFLLHYPTCSFYPRHTVGA